MYQNSARMCAYMDRDQQLLISYTRCSFNSNYLGQAPHVEKHSAQPDCPHVRHRQKVPVFPELTLLTSWLQTRGSPLPFSFDSSLEWLKDSASALFTIIQSRYKGYKSGRTSQKKRCTVRGLGGPKPRASTFSPCGHRTGQPPGTMGSFTKREAHPSFRCLEFGLVFHDISTIHRTIGSTTELLLAVWCQASYVTS